MKTCMIVTNNPLALKAGCPAVFVEGGPADVLGEAARLISQGHRLLSHPLSGSVKPWMSPYKSILLSLDHAEGLDPDSMEAIGQSLSFLLDKPPAPGPIPVACEDMQLVDLDILKGGLASVASGGRE